MARRRNKSDEVRIARDRIRVLLEQARSESLGPDADLADRYAVLAQRVAKRYQVRLFPDQKVQSCRCGVYRRSDNARVRVRRGKVVTTCLACDRVRRRPIHSASPPMEAST